MIFYSILSKCKDIKTTTYVNFLKMWLVFTFQRLRKQCPESAYSSPKCLPPWNSKHHVKIPSFIMECTTSWRRRMLSPAVLCTNKAWINLHFNHRGASTINWWKCFYFTWTHSHWTLPSRFAFTATLTFTMTSLECSASIKINKFFSNWGKFITNESSFTTWNSKKTVYFKLLTDCCS